MTHWNNKTVIITGGGSGIGKSTAAKFFKKGATAYINGRTEAKLKEACEGLKNISEKTVYRDVVWLLIYEFKFGLYSSCRAKPE